MFGVNALGNHLTGQDEPPQIQIQVPSTETPETKLPQSEAASASVSDQYTVSEVASICMPSVVSITNASVKTVIVGQNEKELLIATNNHVVEGADTITVAFNDDAVY